MRGRNPRESYQGHEIYYDEDGWWQVEATDPTATKPPIIVVGGLANGIDEARYFARDFVDGMSSRSAHRRIANVVARKSAAEKFLGKRLRGRKTDYYVLNQGTTTGPYRSIGDARERMTKACRERNRTPVKLSWRKLQKGSGTGGYVSNELSPGVLYELRKEERWDVYLVRGDETMRVASRSDVGAAKKAASRDARELLELAWEITDMRSTNPRDRWDLQTVIVDKDVAAGRDEASAIAREFGKRISTSRQTDESWRFRQRPPGDFVKSSFRTRKIPGRGVSLVYGRLRRGAKGPSKR